MVDVFHIASRVASRTAEECLHHVDVTSQEETGVVDKTPGKGCCVKSEKNSDWSGGCYPTKGEAKDRLHEVEFFKHKKGAEVPKKTFKEKVEELRRKRLEEYPEIYGEPTGDPYHIRILQDGRLVATLSYLADSIEMAKQKLPEMYSVPSGVHGVEVEGPFPGKGE